MASIRHWDRCCQLGKANLALIQGIGQEDVTNQHYRDLEAQFTGSSPNEYLAEGLDYARAGEGFRSAIRSMHWRLATWISACPTRSARFGEKLKVVNIEHPSKVAPRPPHRCNVPRSHAIRTNPWPKQWEAKGCPTVKRDFRPTNSATHWRHGRAFASRPARRAWCTSP